GDLDADMVLGVSYSAVGIDDFLLYECTPAGFKFRGVLGPCDHSRPAVLMDYNGDGLLDVGGVAGPLGNGWLRNRSTPGQFAFDQGPYYTIQHDSRYPFQTTDWDRDGDVDLIYPWYARIYWMENLGSGAFAPPAVILDAGQGASGPILVFATEVADLNGDGFAECLYLVLENSYTTSEVRSIEYQTTGPPQPVHTLCQFEGARGLRSVLPWDPDQDGDLDLLLDIGYQGGVGLSNLENNPNLGAAVACPGSINSWGRRGVLLAVGSEVVAQNNLTLLALNLPPGELGMFLVADRAGAGWIPAGSQGWYCGSGGVGRFNLPQQGFLTDYLGQARLRLDLNSVPSWAGPATVLAGQSRVFQAWHRDQIGGVATSNFSNAVEVPFQ
ncbi:MAG: VCBS repeat-containing protein, partial [Planctomycetes bacterium]|nr:VCBS repeat-containing protein [Planctomycetota bacterium]